MFKKSKIKNKTEVIILNGVEAEKFINRLQKRDFWINEYYILSANNEDELGLFLELFNPDFLDKKTIAEYVFEVYQLKENFTKSQRSFQTFGVKPITLMKYLEMIKKEKTDFNVKLQRNSEDFTVKCEKKDKSFSLTLKFDYLLQLLDKTISGDANLEEVNELTDYVYRIMAKQRHYYRRVWNKNG